MPLTRTARSRAILPAALVAVAGLVAVPIVVHASKDSPVATANAADSTVTALPNVGRVETCVLDAYSGCTVLHGFGQKPVAITATASGPAMLSIDPRRTTDQSYRLRALRYDGQRYQAGTKLSYTVHYDFAAVAGQPTIPAPTTAPTSAPTTSTPKPSPTPTSTTTSTKPPTTTTPTTSAPTTTAPTTTAPPAAGTCKNPVWSSSDAFGTWNTSGYLVNNNKWNEGEAGPQSIHACGFNSWYVTSDQKELASNPGSVKTYPDTQKNFPDKAISSFGSIKSTYANSQSAPSSGEYNWSYDIWLNGLGNEELMIWTNYRYPGSLPPGDAQDKATATIGGHTFTAWKRGAVGSRYIALAMTDQKAVSSVDLKAVFDWLVSKGWLSGTDKVSAIEYGVEISSTNGPQTFRLDDYSLTTS
ncbi:MULTISPECIES: hypothetical protein [Kribbella]|jgi:hypothetical protein|uniref:Glycosyl hydrolase family 12 n=1 Tax=Kribbella pratensis TaxID=2512112 RepID=A0ABY2FC48_9ACTN|nr:MULTISPECIES: hypothetical protein [Kribbella]TDW87806.1 glycosyl hydrolase family 12 [Kribbella pratensis]TDW88999.1 glycosyl hydrolase family 12 [Kribbella sp. VKM Ac-2566]